MAIEVGDAILRFLGDSTQLDQAFVQVGETAETKLGPARATLAEINAQLTATGGTAISALAAQRQYGDAVLLTTKELVDAQREAKGFGTEAQVAAEKAAFSMREAKGEIALLGDEIGIKIPRHLRGFVAELPGVGEALNAAFSATAVLILLQLLVEGTTKLTEFISSTFIFTKAMEEANKNVLEANKVLVDLAKQYVDLKQKVEDFGKNAVELTTNNLAKLQETQKKNAESLADMTKEYQKNREASEAAKTSIDAINASYEKQGLILQLLSSFGQADANKQAEAVKKLADAENAELVNKIAIAQQQAKVDKERVEEATQLKGKALEDQAKAQEKAYQTAAAAELVNNQAVLKSAIELQKARDLIAVDGAANNGAIVFAINQRAEEQIYQLEKTTLEKKLELAKEDPYLAPGVQEKLYAELAVLRNKEFGRTEVDVNALNARIAASVSKDLNAPLLQFTEVTLRGVVNGFQQASDAAKLLGFSTDNDLKKSLADTQKAFDQLKASGVATYGDLLKGQIALAKASLELAKDQGTATEDQENALRKLEKEYDRLYGSVDKVYAKHTQLFQLWQKGAPTAAEAYQGAMNIAEQGLDRLGKAAQNAFASAIMGQESLGVALAKATEQTLANLASQAIVQALFYTAMGFAKLAVYDFGGAQNAFTAAAIYGAVGGAAAGAAIGVGAAIGGGGSGNGQATSPNTVAGSANQALSATASQTTPNVQKFASGGLVNGPTLAMMGEDAGHGTEAAIPLDNPDAVAAIKKALVGDDGGKTVVHQWHVQGLVSPDNLHKIMKKMSAAADSGRGRLTSSNSTRLTRKV